jgi:hypothetical protein
MKKILLLFLFTATAFSQVNLTYSWDYNAAGDSSGYKLWSSPNIGLTNSVLLSATSSNSVVITHTNAFVGWIYVTATNDFGLESDKSAPVKVDLRKPSKPLRVTVTLN